GIRLVSETMARELASRFPDVRQLFETPPEALEAIPGFGDVRRRAVSDFFSKSENRRVIERLLAAGVPPAVEAPSLPRIACGPLSGRAFVLTSALSSMTRGQAKAEIERRGGRVPGSVSSKTGCVVAGRDHGTN